MIRIIHRKKALFLYKYVIRRFYRRRSFKRFSVVLFCVLSLCRTASLRSESRELELLKSVNFDQKLDEQIPLDLSFADETGRPLKLEKLFSGQPVILVFAYYECPMLCTLVLNGLLRSLKTLPFTIGKEFDVITISFDPTEKHELAAAKKEKYVQQYKRPQASKGWHFLTGQPAPIWQLTQAAGFRYAYDSQLKQYAHPSGIIVLTPEGKISRYFYGVEYSPIDLRLALVEASKNRIGSPIDRVLLYCYQYNPSQGKYGIAILRALRLGGILTLATLGTIIFVMVRKERQKLTIG